MLSTYSLNSYYFIFLKLYRVDVLLVIKRFRLLYQFLPIFNYFELICFAANYKYYLVSTYKIYELLYYFTNINNILFFSLLWQ